MTSSSSNRLTHLRHFARTVLLGSLVITGILGTVRQLGGFQDAEFAAYDRLMAHKPSSGIDPHILVVGINEDDIQERQEYPIHDDTIAALLTTLETYEPRAIGLDVIRDIPQGPAAGREKLLNILSESDRIVAACVLSSPEDPGASPPPGVAAERVAFAGFPQDRGNVVRRTTLLSTPARYSPRNSRQHPARHLCNNEKLSQPVPSLGFSMALEYLKLDGITPKAISDQELDIGSVRLKRLKSSSGAYRQEFTGNYQLLLNYRGDSNVIRQVSLSDILQGQVDPSWITNRMVLIGYTSPIHKDIFTTPYSQAARGSRQMSGVVLHAQAASQLLSAVLDERPLLNTGSKFQEAGWIWFWAILGGSLAFYYRQPLVLALLTGGAIAGCWFICKLLFQQGLWLPLVPSAWAILLTAFSILLLKQAQQGGYAQAIYEQLRGQLKAQTMTIGLGRQNSFRYLEALVQRAQQIRLSQDEALSSSAVETPQLEKQSLLPELELGHQGQQELYEQIRTQVEQDIEREQTALAALQTQQSQAQSDERLQKLLNRAQTLREEASPKRYIVQESSSTQPQVMNGKPKPIQSSNS